jgi:hypothetical protein
MCLSRLFASVGILACEEFSGPTTPGQVNATLCSASPKYSTLDTKREDAEIVLRALLYCPELHTVPPMWQHRWRAALLTLCPSRWMQRKLAAGLSRGRTQAAPTALVLHGLLGQGKNWRTTSRRLAREAEAATNCAWRVLTLDLRCHGASTGVAGLHPPHDMVSSAQDIVRFVQQHLKCVKPGPGEPPPAAPQTILRSTAARVLALGCMFICNRKDAPVICMVQASI